MVVSERSFLDANARGWKKVVETSLGAEDMLSSALPEIAYAVHCKNLACSR